jgi:tetratricopeptide (TPR) repeat protein
LGAEWQIGDRIQNRWDIHGILRGGMGIVYVVYDHEHRNAYAAKTYQDKVFARAQQIVTRFAREALTWINLDAHQNITEARFLQYIEGKPYLFLEYVSGGDLSKWIGTPRLTQDLPQVLRFAIQFCDGMMHASSKGIAVHRDIKPENCLVTQDKTLKVTDFGLARVFEDLGHSEVEIPDLHSLSVGLSRTGTAFGTCTHMAPEQFDDAKHVDARADFYSFGVLLYQMVTGKLPFEGRTWQEYEHLHKSQRVPPLDRQFSLLNKVLQQCLAKEPASRYGEFYELRNELAEIYETLTGEAAPQPVSGTILNASQWVNKGVSLNGLGRREEALQCFNRSLEIDPLLAVAWSSKGIALVQLGREDEALACFDSALEINPSYGQAWNNKGNTLTGLGRLEEGIVCLERALEINPRDEMAWSNKGCALHGLERRQEAVACYDRALVINPRDEKAWYNKGLSLFQLGRREEALVCYDRALAINPLLEQAWYDKGLTLGQLGRGEEALACFDCALEINPRDGLAWFGKGSTLGQLLRLEEALTCYNRALAINLSDAKAWYYKGIVLDALGHPEEAQACRDRAIAIDPSYAEA